MIAELSNIGLTSEMEVGDIFSGSNKEPPRLAPTVHNDHWTTPDTNNDVLY